MRSEVMFTTHSGTAKAVCETADPPSAWADITVDLTITWTPSLSTYVRVDATRAVTMLSHTWDGNNESPSLSPFIHQDRWGEERFRFFLRAGHVVVGKLDENGDTTDTFTDAQHNREQ